MKFRTKLILGFSFVVFIISAVLGCVSYNLNSKRYKEKSNQTLQYYAQQAASSVDYNITSMKQVTDIFLSDPDMLYAMKSLAKCHMLGNELEIEELTDTLNSGVSMNYINNNFYRVIIFNEQGDVESSTNAGRKLTNKKRDISKIEWLDDAAEMHGRPILLAPHDDDWGVQSHDEVFSLARKVQGGDFGYIEVQYATSDLAGILELPDTEIKVVALMSDGEVLYASDGIEKEGIEAVQKLDGNGRLLSENTLTAGGVSWNLAASVSNDYGIKIAALLQDGGSAGDMRQALMTALGMAMACFAISMVVVVFFANKLSGPLIALKNQMEDTGIENLDTKPQIFNTNDEVEALSIAYKDLIKRLNESIVKEKRMSLLQLQAQYDTLQAQVNPHFIYNVLNVISSRGVIDGDEYICEICGSLAAMLRYSTNTKERYATVDQEMEYLKQYLFLLKSRYEHRLEVEIECEDSIKKEILPKIVLQQLVENSIQHGYENTNKVMQIRIRGWRNETGWYVEACDNGNGITKEVEARQKEKMRKVRERILTRDSSIEMEIGGMGLANTYARMYLLYNDNVIFEMQNIEQGLKIVIGVVQRREESDVSGTGG